MAIQGRMDKTEGDSLALEMAERALEIDPDLAEAHTVLASIFIYNRNWDAAEREFLKALALNANYSTVHQYYAEYLILMGRNLEARKHIDIALQIDPFSFIIRHLSSGLYYHQEQFDKALEEIKVCLDLNKNHPWANSLEYYIYLALEDDPATLDCSKRYGKMRDLWSPEEVDSVYQEGGFDGIIRWNMRYFVGGEYGNEIFNVVPNEHKKTIELIESAMRNGNLELYIVFYAMLGEHEKTMDLLELLMDAEKLPPYITTYRQFKSLRSNPRFIAIREKMGLPPLKP
jgi:tetratricopeptide (TPR) repeat protein